MLVKGNGALLVGRRTIPQFPIRSAALALAIGVSVGACSTYGGYGSGYGQSSRVSLGYSSNPYWGWNSDYYYPGTGYYVYDSYRRPHRWTLSQQRYWTGRQTPWRSHDRRAVRNNWRDFRRDRRDRDGRRDRRN